VLGFLVKAGVDSVTGSIVVRAPQQYEVDKKLAEWGTAAADKLLTTLVSNNITFGGDKEPETPAPTPAPSTSWRAPYEH